MLSAIEISSVFVCLDGVELTTIYSFSVIRTRPSSGTRQKASTGISRQGMRQLIITCDY